MPARTEGFEDVVKESAERMKALMKEARAETLRLFDMASEAGLHESPGFGFRPIIWHLAHVGVFEAYWILQKLRKESAPDERYERIFDPINTPREESRNLPTRREMEDYLTRVRSRVLRALDATGFDESNPLTRDGYVFRLVLEHEYQHQETLAYLLQLLDPSKKTRPQGFGPGGPTAHSLTSPPAGSPEMVIIPAGAFRMGSVWDSFAYDNELPAHTVELPAYRLDRLPVTNAEYAVFIAEGGYERREFWSEEGWRWRERENWSSPLYWMKARAGWRVRTMFDEGELAPTHPVTGVSWYEAEAYARFRGKRLPTEAEWERAASSSVDAPDEKRRFSWGDEEPSEALCNFNNNFWGTTSVGSFPLGASSSGCMDMTGNVWEWTADAFTGYEGFAPYPYPEYSETWFDGDHRVLKGGSWATRASVLRTSFRNFFRRHFRIAFAGIRCASDV